jgi:hypothetical protein
LAHDPSLGLRRSVRSVVKDLGLFKQVLEHRQVFFAHNWVDYRALDLDTLRLLPLPDQEAGWRADYFSMQGEMFSATPPSFEAVLTVVGQFEQLIKKHT